MTHVQIRKILGVVAALCLSTATASAQCDPSGRAAFGAGLEALGRGDLTVAGREFFELVEAQPRCPEARNNLAVVLVEQGRLLEAAEQLRTALALDPGYQRARFNLQRVEALTAAAAGAAPPVRNAIEPQSPPVAPEPGAGATPPESTEPAAAMVKPAEAKSEPAPPEPSPNAKPPEKKVAEAPAPSPSAPAGPSMPEQRGTTASVIEPQQNRLCLLQRAVAGAAASGSGLSDECYAFAAVQVRAWPRWVVASEVTAKRIRLLDESGQTRLEIVPEDTPVSGDAIRLRQGDYDTFAGKIIPWRTGWVILE